MVLAFIKQHAVRSQGDNLSEFLPGDFQIFPAAEAHRHHLLYVDSEKLGRCEVFISPEEIVIAVRVFDGVSDEFVRRHAGTKSHITLAFLDEHNDAQNIFYKDHASAALDGELPHIQASDIVLFGSFFAINPAIRPVVRSMLRKAREVGAWLYYDINFRKTHIADIPQVMVNIEENMQLANIVRGSMEDFGYLYNLTDADAIYERVRPFCLTLILTDGARTIRVYSPAGCETYPVQPIETVSTVGAGDNFNAGYIYAMLKGIDDSAARIAMAQRWSQDVCRQLGNNISDELVAQLKS